MKSLVRIWGIVAEGERVSSFEGEKVGGQRRDSSSTRAQGERVILLKAR